MLRYSVYTLVLVIFPVLSTVTGQAQDLTVYVTGEVHASLVTICPCADPLILVDNSLGEDLFLAGDDLLNYEGAQVEIVGERVDCGDCVKIDVRYISFLPAAHAYGDLNGDNIRAVDDVVIAIDYLLREGFPPPSGWRAADLDANGQTNLADAVRLINLVFGRANLLQGTVWGRYPCSPFTSAYPGCKYWVLKNSIPLDTGTVDENGRFSVLLPADRYMLALFPPESNLMGHNSVDLTQGNFTLPTPSPDRDFVDTLVLVSGQPEVTDARIAEIAGYLGGYILEIDSRPHLLGYFVVLPPGLHFERAMAILRMFPEIAAVEPVEILCP
jgi:hypothetical protein